MNFDNLIKIRKNKRERAIPSLRKPVMGLCKNCQIGKMGKTSFKRKNYHFEEVLELVHIDLCGPIGVEIYSGCSNHMTRDKTKFEVMEPYDGGSVRFGNSEPCCIKGKGCISLTNELVCDNAYWVEGLKHNLLSVAQLNNIGFKIEFIKGKAKLLDGKGNLVRSSKKTNVIYSI